MGATYGLFATAKMKPESLETRLKWARKQMHQRKGKRKKRVTR